MTDPTPAVPDPGPMAVDAKKPKRPWRDNLEAFGVDGRPVEEILA